jgi:NAD(P)-dependent dehydrogenase (short-subunit alcohol dehydrogenase family)
LSTSVIVGRSSGIERHLAQRRADRGDTVPHQRRESRAHEAADETGDKTVGLATDLTEPSTITDSLQPVTEVGLPARINGHRPVVLVSRHSLC